jgi:hypothetical protein
MSDETMIANDNQTLAQRLAEGRLPIAEALRYAMQLADCLGKLHDVGKAHGAVTPSNLVVVAGGVELLPPPEGSSGAITPYTAPEVVQGRAADARSDVFGFGAILFEMITGRRAFEGDSRITLAANLLETPAPASGSPTVDRLVGPCLNKNPEARSQRMQKIMMELKLLSVAMRRSEADAAAAPRRDAAADTAAIRAEVQQLEVRMEARLRDQETSVTEMHRSASATDTAAVLAEMQQLEARMGARLRDQETSVTEMHRSASAADTAAVLAEMQQLEARMGARLRDQETSVTEMHRSASAADTAAIRAEVQQLEARMDARLRDQETSVTEMHRSASAADTAAVLAEMQQMEARMDARLRDQETGLTEMQRSANAADAAAVRAEMQQMEARIEARLRSQETSASEMNRSANEGLSSLKLLVAAMQSELAANHQQAMERAGGLDEAATEAIFARVDRGFEVLNAQVAGIERTVEEIRRHSSQFENNIAADLLDLEQTIKAQGTSIESARTAMSQTEDLVEFVVEALESLQTAMADPDEISRRSNLAVN